MNDGLWLASALLLGGGLAVVLIPVLVRSGRAGRSDRDGSDGGFVPVGGDSGRRSDDADYGSDGGGGDGGGGGD